MAIQILNITKSGTGTGTVISDVGIPTVDCGLTCSVAETSGSLVTLTAIPDAGSVFVGWTGDLISSSNPASYVQTLNPTNINAEFRLRRKKKGGFGGGVVLPNTIPVSVLHGFPVPPTVSVFGQIYDNPVLVENPQSSQAHNSNTYIYTRATTTGRRNIVGLGSVDTSVKK